jgi:hypothetical protein
LLEIKTSSESKNLRIALNAMALRGPQPVAGLSAFAAERNRLAFLFDALEPKPLRHTPNVHDVVRAKTLAPQKPQFARGENVFHSALNRSAPAYKRQGVPLAGYGNPQRPAARRRELFHPPAGTFEGEFSNATASYAGKGVVRYSW